MADLAPADEAAIADLLALTARQVRELARDGVLPRLSVRPVRYDIRAAVRAYLEHVRGRSRRPSKTEADEEYRAEKTRLAREQADARAMENARRRGELIAADEAAREWAAVLRNVRAAMLTAPTRISAALPHLSAADVHAVDRVVRDLLEEASRHAV